MIAFLGRYIYYGRLFRVCLGPEWNRLNGVPASGAGPHILESLNIRTIGPGEQRPNLIMLEVSIERLAVRAECLGHVLSIAYLYDFVQGVVLPGGICYD